LPTAPVPPPPPASIAVPPEPAAPLASANTDNTVIAPIVVTPARPASRQVDMHPLADIRLGMLMLARDGRINATGGSASYDGALAAPVLSLSVFPWARHAAGAWERGLGFYGEGYLTRVSADFGPASTSAEATVSGFEAGGAYRFAMMSSSRAPVVILQAGYAYASFPISGAPFPGISYSSAELGFVVDLPIAAHLAGFAGGRVFPWMTAGGDSGRIGKADTLYALRGEAGLRLVMAPLEVVAAGRFQQYTGTFNGVTDLQLASELENVAFKDRYYGGILSVGFTL
jgi:hypothetical protein